MTLLVDTSVWSLALRRDAPAEEPEVQVLKEALAGAEIVVITGLTCPTEVRSVHKSLIFR